MEARTQAPGATSARRVHPATADASLAASRDPRTSRLQVLTRCTSGDLRWCPAFAWHAYTGGKGYAYHLYVAVTPGLNLAALWADGDAFEAACRTGGVRRFAETEARIGYAAGRLRRTYDAPFAPCIGPEAAHAAHRLLGARLRGTGYTATEIASEVLGRAVLHLRHLTARELSRVVDAAGSVRERLGLSYPLGSGPLHLVGGSAPRLAA